ncbi:alkaline phosphatase D family protein [Cryobacterium sp. TMT2-42-4]|uniref:alkaline phosphatase D family protein n=1 Tax=Cryobacterium sp. TMT2-42-4 TaxID=1259255 RepID=UPI00106C3951|nr:alkaline phosphatase D family protein [Cryobacterium sp. TMT2-42-4]TFC36722.1 alkaline phosphatase family protein [Cryobacterium sp. TMT2-42-4]
MTTTPLVLGPMLRYVDTVSASIWVETRGTASVGVDAGNRSWTARTFAVHGHHYALVHVDGLGPGTVTPYTVSIDGAQVWPPADSVYPASVITTLTPGAPLRLSFGSCRTSVPHDKKGTRTHGVDALRAYALQMAEGDGILSWPDLMLFLGDQVYADLTSEAMQEFIRDRRDIREPPGEELADFEEYAHLYNLAWSDTANRWLLATVPVAMIFDDHDVRDDWNASLSWKRRMEATSWWHGRIVAGLASYWVYQHLGNLSPGERAHDEVWQAIQTHDGAEELDLSSVLDGFAERCDREPTTYRWSYCRDLGEDRLIVLDSRAARELDPRRRALVDEQETAWFDERMQGGFRHLVVATSLPFLLPPGVADIITDVADGKRGAAPQPVTFLSGDVHYSYVSELDRTSGNRIIQAVCSPIRNPLPILLRSVSAVLSYGMSTRLSALLSRSVGVPPPPFHWSGIIGPWFDNCLATVADTPDGLRLSWASGVVDGGDPAHPTVTERAAITVAPRRDATLGR